MNMNKQQSGFTLIELMIVVAIIGILAAIAIPSYMDYTKKARVSEVMLATAPYKLAIAETYASSNNFPTGNSSAGIDDFTATDTVASVSIDGSSNVVATATTAVGTLTLTLDPTDTGSGISWVCTSSGDDSNLAPSECR